ncbi:PHP domain-containing protein [bacterium]|nr:PHP domain-containing protein [bacterium]
MDLNGKVSLLLLELANGREIKGENPFRVRALRKGARLIGKWEGDLGECEDTTVLPGIGPSMSAMIEEVKKSGVISQLERLRDEIPSGVWDLLSIQGIGPSTAGKLWQEGVTDPTILLEMLESGDLRSVKGTRRSLVLEGLKHHFLYKGSFLRSDALKLLEAFSQAHPEWQISPSGGFRRGQEVLDHIPLLVLKEDGVSEALSLLFGNPLSQGQFEGRWGDRHFLIRLANRQEWGRVSIEESSTPEHLEGLLLRDGQTEEEVYRLAGSPYWPPELRGYSRSLYPKGPPKLVKEKDILADYHTHTRQSDGRSSLPEMVHAAAQWGHRRVAITDHSQTAGYAGGLSPESLLRQREEIRQGDWPLEVWAGTESDILPDGSLDYKDDLLARLDWVVGSIHQGLKGDQTERVLEALDNPHLKVLGHPTGRRLLLRDGFSLDWSKVLPKMAERGIALEINGNPERLDAEADVAREASREGVKIALGTDAHHTSHFALMSFGVTQARRAGLTKDNLLNTTLESH